MASTQQREAHTGLPALLTALRRRMGLVVACAILVPAAALAFSLAQQKQYSASASLLFRDPQFDQKLFGSTVFAPNIDPNREAATNVKLVSLEVVAARTTKALGGRVSPGTISSEVTVASAGQSDVATITATDPNPELAAKLANTFAAQFIAFRRDADRSKIASAEALVQQQLNNIPRGQRSTSQATDLRNQAENLKVLAALQTGNAELVQPAQAPGAPSSPKPVRNAVLGLLLGLLLGVGLAILRERLDRRLRDAEEISEAFDRPVLGAIPESRTIAKVHETPLDLSAAEAEAFRMLRANLRYFNVDRQVKSVLITSASPAEGKSTVAVHLAAAAARTGQRVLLLEADLRRPTLPRKLQISARVGLSHVLSGDATLGAATESVSVGGTGRDGGVPMMDVLVAGPIPPNPSDLIESDRMRQIIRTAEAEYDLVVIDTPPTSVVSDAIPLVKEVSGVIVVTRLGRTTRESAAHLRNQLENLDAHTLGVVVNSIGRTGRYGYGAGYGYGYGHGYGYEPRIKEPASGASNGSSRHAEQEVAAVTNSAANHDEHANGHSEGEIRFGEDYLEEERRPPAPPPPAPPPPVRSLRQRLRGRD